MAVVSLPSSLMDPGPIDDHVLYAQATHRSQLVWDGQGVSLRCRRREATLRHAPPHPRTIPYIHRAGLGSLLQLSFISLDWQLITTLVERWRPETHTFHMRNGEMTITLEDVAIIFGLHVDGDVVTGESCGSGAETTQVLAMRGIHVVMTVRNNSAESNVKEAILKETPTAKVDVLDLDLSSFTSVRKFASDFDGLNLPLNILINNAGIMATPFSLSHDIFALQFATNHLGHFLLTDLLLENMKKTFLDSMREGRIINDSSEAHQCSYGEGIRSDKINDKQSYNTMDSYGQSKLANILHANQLSKHLQESGSLVMVDSLYPGSIATNLLQHHSYIQALAMTLGKLILRNVQQEAHLRFMESRKSCPVQKLPLDVVQKEIFPRIPFVTLARARSVSKLWLEALHGYTRTCHLVETSRHHICILDSCSLDSIEVCSLGVFDHDDFEGFLMDIYFNSRLRGMFMHLRLHLRSQLRAVRDMMDVGLARGGTALKKVTIRNNCFEIATGVYIYSRFCGYVSTKEILRAVYVDGSLHWLGYNHNEETPPYGHRIITLDLTTEKMAVEYPPEEALTVDACDFSLAALGKELGFVRHDFKRRCVDVWIKGTSAGEGQSSWHKRYSLDLKQLGDESVQAFRHGARITGSTDSDICLLMNEEYGEFALFDTLSRRLRMFTIPDGFLLYRGTFQFYFGGLPRPGLQE